MLNSKTQAEIGQRINQIFQDLKNEVNSSTPSIYSQKDVEAVLIKFLSECMVYVGSIPTTETEVAEQTYTLSEIREAIESLDFNYSDFCTLEVNEWGNECKIEAGICTHEIEDYVQSEVIEFLNNIEK